MIDDPIRPLAAPASGDTGAIARVALCEPESCATRLELRHHVLRDWRIPRPRSHRFSRARRLLKKLLRSAPLDAAHLLFSHLPGLSRIYDAQLRRGVDVLHAEIALPGLDPAWQGARLLAISDLHCGPFVSPNTVEYVLREIRSQVAHDVVLLLGDNVAVAAREIEPFRQALRALTDPTPPVGAFAVLGNHDHWNGPGRVHQALEEIGLDVIDNDARTLVRTAPVGGSQAGAGAALEGTLELLGIDDLKQGNGDLAAATAASGGMNDHPRILLSHDPDILFEAAEAEIDLVLSGHTHGGQIRLPGLPPLVTQSRHRLAEGGYRVGSTRLVLGRGLGVTSVPVRVACRPQVVLIRLEKTPGAARRGSENPGFAVLAS